MISEVLLYLLMIPCMLTRVSSKEVKWTVRDTSPKLGQDLTLFCKVDNCTVDETKRWYGGPDVKPLMSNSGISTDKTKYNTSIEKNGFILTILHLTVKDLNVSYECSCGFDLDNHILYIEDVYRVDNLNKSTNDTNDVETIDAGMIIGYIAIPVIPVMLLIIVIVIKRHWLWRKLKEKIYCPRRRNSDKDDSHSLTSSLLPNTPVDSDLIQSAGQRQLEEREIEHDKAAIREHSVDSIPKQEKIEALTLEKEECIPHNIREQHQDLLKEWNVNMFVPTRASKAVFDCISEQPSVTVTGNPGVGKTATMRYVALKMKGKGYTVVPTKSPKDIINFSAKGKSTLFVVDNVCGDYTVDPHRIRKWKDMSESIQSLLDNKYCKIISTCRLQICNDVRFKDLSFFNGCECNLNSDELCLTLGERSNLALKYFEGKASEVSAFLEEYDFFPLLCALYQKDKHVDIKSFFKKPFDFYKNEIDKLSASDCEKDHCKVCALALCVIFNNRFKEEYLTTKNKEIQRVIQNTLLNCNLSKYSSFEKLHEALCTLDGTLVVNVDKVYRTIHDKLYDFLACYFGGEKLELIIKHVKSDFISDRFLWETKDNITKDIPYTILITDKKILEKYIERILRDWSKGEVLAVFTNRNMKSPSFIAKLVDRLRRRNHSNQEKLALMTDNRNQDSTLLQSCFVGDPDLTRWILKFTVDDLGNSDIRHKGSGVVNTCRNNGESPLHIVCQEGHLDIVKQLLDKKVNTDVNKCLDDGASPLYFACQNGHLDIVKQLLDKKVNTDVNKCKDNGASPLFVACQMGHLKIVLQLLDEKVNTDVNKCLDDGTSPLYAACLKGNLDIVLQLLDKKVNTDVNKCMDDGSTLLCIACRKGHLDIVLQLLDEKVNADVNKCRNDGASPLFFACLEGRLNIVLQLLDEKVNADVNKCRHDGASPLYIACQEGHLDIVQQLLDKKVNLDVNKCRDSGESPLYVACQNGHDKIVKILLTHGTDINKRGDNSYSPLYIACYGNHINVVEELLKVQSPKVDIDLCDSNECTSLYLACEKRYTNIARILLEHHADPHRSSKNGNSPFTVAQQEGFKEILDIIEQHSSHEIP